MRYSFGFRCRLVSIKLDCLRRVSGPYWCHGGSRIVLLAASMGCTEVRLRDSIGIFLGGAPLPYCTLLMSHSAVVSLLAIAIWAGRLGLKPSICEKATPHNCRDVIAGLCSGLALASEYGAGLVVVGICVWYFFSDLKRAVIFGLGMVPSLLTIPGYHWICFGDPFTFAYLHEHTFTTMHEGFFGIRFPPQTEHAYMLLFSAERGLFFWSPILLLAFPGYFRLWHTSPPLFWMTYLVPVLQVTAISAYFLPSAGGMIGPRLLAPILPLLALPLALGVTWFPRTGAVLGIVSILVTVLATVVSIAGLYGANPLFDLLLPKFFALSFSHNLGQVAGLSGYTSIIPLVVVLVVSIWLTWCQLPRSEASIHKA